MSDAKLSSAEASGLNASVPAWLGAGLIGLVLGVGGTLIVLRVYEGKRVAAPDGISNMPVATTPSPPMGGGGMGGGMMGGPPMGMMGMGGGGRPQEKNNLTNLVGKLELLTRETLHVDLDPEQTGKIAEQLAKLDQAEKMTTEEAKEHLATLEAMLTPDQKTKLDAIGLPFRRPGGGGGGPGGGPGGPGGPGGGPGGPMMSGPMGGGGAEDENPFKRETNQKRLRDLLGRIKPNEPSK